MNDGNTEFITFATKSCIKKEDLPELRVGDDVAKAQTPETSWDSYWIKN